jgi:hypothetical protein
MKAASIPQHRARSYARFELCVSCQPPTGAGLNGGDLLALARSSTAGIVAASKLVQYASDLQLYSCRRGYIHVQLYRTTGLPILCDR